MPDGTDFQTGLTKWNAMRVAIDECHAVDEVKDIRDKARGLEEYARQANDRDLERKVHEIRVRAERRVGELLREMPKATGTRGAGRPQIGGRSDQPPKPPDAPKPLSDLGITKDQSALWQKLAAVPEKEFEAEVANSGALPTAASIVAAHEARNAEPPAEPGRPADPKALSLWGHLKDFRREGLLGLDPNHICDTMPEHMLSAVRELAPVVANWLKGIP